MRFTINCDLGEGFGRYRVAEDSRIMPLIDLANIGCGFHASDPMIMAETARLAALHGIGAGAHPSVPDLQGFGRREMRLTRAEVAGIVRYQVGALKGFLDAAGVALSHVKPHGALYGMAARDEAVAQGICDGAEGFTDTLLGLTGTAHEVVYAARGFALVPEFYADLDYADDGMLIVGGHPAERDPDSAAERAVVALTEGRTLSQNGQPVAIRATSVCVHSDSGNAAAVIRAIRARLPAAAPA